MAGLPCAAGAAGTGPLCCPRGPLELNEPRWQTVATFEDGEALFVAVCARGLEGVVAKRLSDPYRPGERCG
jgi:ATP-dependent DNA ligase